MILLSIEGFFEKILFLFEMMISCMTGNHDRNTRMRKNIQYINMKETGTPP
jgi:hypothetical protein